MRGGLLSAVVLGTSTWAEGHSSSHPEPSTSGESLPPHPVLTQGLTLIQSVQGLLLI